MFLSVIADNTLATTIAPVLVQLVQETSKDSAALAKVELGRTAAAYKLKYGVAKSITDGIVVELQMSPFLLNVDEATGTSHKKVLTLLVNHFSDSMGKVVTNHWASVELQKATSESVFGAICEVFDSYQLPWSNLISVLFDSCAVMRGCKAGVEKKNQRPKSSTSFRH